MIADRDKAARELIAFYHEAGVDAAVREEPIDRLAESLTPALDDNAAGAAATAPTRERPRSSPTAPPASRTRAEPRPSDPRRAARSACTGR